MFWTKQFDLFLFDMDGLLVDTEHLHYKAYQKLCARHGCALPWTFLKYLSVAHCSSDGIARALLPLLGAEVWAPYYEEKKAIYQELLAQGELQLMPGVEPLLLELTKIGAKRCVVTNSTRKQTEAIKDILPILKTIPLWITREDYNRPKPAPDGYLKALEELAGPHDRVVGFEDSLRGVVSLQGTIATPVLICDPAHPQMGAKELRDVLHFSSFVLNSEAVDSSI